MERFSNRIQGLAASHDVLVNNNWQGVDLTTLINSQLAFIGELAGTRVLTRGQPQKIGSSAAQIIGLALHELATNACKYGALSGDTGVVTVSWHADRSNDTFFMSWVERGGPTVAPPTRRGFGSTVTDTMVKSGLFADVTITFCAQGLKWHLRCPTRSLRHELK